MCKEALHSHLALAETRTTTNAHLALGRTYLFLEDLRAARRHLEKGLSLARKVSFPREESIACEFLGDLERAEGRSEAAGELYEKAMEIALRIAPGGDLTCEIGRRLAEWRLERKELAEARSETERALALAEKIKDRREEGILHRVRTRLVLASGGRYQSAEASAKKSVEILLEVGARYEEVLSRVELGRLQITSPRKRRSERRRGLREFERAAGILSELDLPLKRAALLVDAVELAEGVCTPPEGLRMLQEAEAIIREKNDAQLLERIDQLRRLMEEETARLAVERDGPLLLGDDASGKSLDRSLRLLSRRLGGKKSFLYVEGAIEGPRVVGCQAEEAARLVGRLEFPGDRNLIVSSGNLSQDRGDCYGPHIAIRFGQDRPLVLYLERKLGEAPFTEREAAEFAAYGERLIERLPVCYHSLPDGPYPTVIAASRSMQDVVDRIVSIRNSMATVLIEGETGTGKGLLATLLHQLSDRAKGGRFVHVHCAELPESLLESELFGHVRGSFTGAVSDKQGLFEIARGGTLFLDEVGDLSSAVQVRLLRVIEEGRLKRVGEARDREIDVRVVAATHADLDDEVEGGRFRKDLFYRLHVIRARVPPLRERREDIPPLARHFIKLYAREERKRVAGIEPEAMTRLVCYSWPGNVRQLQNEIRRIIALLSSGEPIRVRDLSKPLHPRRGTSARPSLSKGRLLREVASYEEERIHQAIQESHGKLVDCAGALGISPQLLRYKLKKYGIQFPKK